MARKESRQEQNAREQLGKAVRYRDPDEGGDGKYAVVWKYDGSVVKDYDSADAAFKAVRNK